MAEDSIEKALTLIRKDKAAVKMTDAAKDLTALLQKIAVTDEASEKEASQLLIQARGVIKQIDGIRDTFVRPHNLIVRAYNNFFKSAIDPLELSAGDLSRRMGKFRADVESAAKKKEAAILAKVEQGKIKEETAVQKLAEIGKPAEVIRSDSGSVNYTTIKRVGITNLSLIPREYLIPDIKLIESDLKNGKEIPGATLIEEKVARTRTNW